MSPTRMFALFTILAAGCATAPSTRAEKDSLQQSADATLSEMTARDPSIRSVIDQAPAYVVFPSIGKGGVIAGGAFGRGILYEQGRPTGYVSVEQASLGAQLGGETFAELLVLRAPRDIEDVKAGHFTASADAGVVVLGKGAARQGTFDTGTTAYVLPRGGLMVDVSISGQRLKYQSFST